MALRAAKTKEVKMKTMGAKNTGAAKKARGMLLAVVALAALTGAPNLAAQDSWSKWNCGLQLGGLMPTGEKLSEVANIGVGVAGYAEIIWSSGWALRGRGEYTAFGENEAVEHTQWGFSFIRKTKVIQLGAMLDLIYYSRNSTLYPFMGAGYFIRSFKHKVEVTNLGISDEMTTVPSTPAVSVGGGWNLANHLGLEVKYSFSTDGMAWTQASLLYRF